MCCGGGGGCGGQSPTEPHEYINIYVIFTADIKKYKLMFTVHSGFKYF